MRKVSLYKKSYSIFGQVKDQIYRLSVYDFFIYFLDHVWRRLANILLNETKENYMEKVDKFYAHLLSLKNKNQNDSSSKLLNNIPSFEITQTHSIYNNNSFNGKNKEENEDDNEQCPSQIRKFLLRFLRGGNHNIESATKLLLDYLQMMKDHPNYYDGLTNSGNGGFNFHSQIFIAI